MMLTRYKFRSVDAENTSDQYRIYFVKRATLNCCDVRAVEIYDARKGRFTGITFHLDAVNNRKLAELTEEERSTWLNLFRRINPAQFTEDNYRTIDKPKDDVNFLAVLDEFMKDLDAVTSFLSTIIK